MIRLLIYRDDSYMATTGGVNLVLFSTISDYISALKYGNIPWDEFLINIIANVLIFVPYGYFLLLYTQGHYTGFIVFFGLATVCFVEYYQYVRNIGIFDVDDIFLNTLGIVIGIVLYKWLKGKKGDSNESSRAG